MNHNETTTNHSWMLHVRSHCETSGNCKITISSPTMDSEAKAFIIQRDDDAPGFAFFSSC